MKKLKVKTTKIYNDLNEDYRIIILRGGTRSSKSYSAIQYLIINALSNPGTTISIVRKTLPSLKKSVLRDFKKIMNDFNIYEDKRFSQTELIYSFGNGSIIEFFSIQDEQRIRGSQRSILFVDEANELTYDDFFQLNIRTTGKSIICFNPSFNPSTHWIYQKIEIREDAKEFISTYRDNPFLPQTIIDEIEKLKFTSPSLYKIYANGEFGKTEGLVYDNFNTIEEIPPDAIPISIGVDFGFSQDPTAVSLLYKWNDSIIVKELLYRKGMLSNQIAEFLLNSYKEYGRLPIVADSADPRLIQEIKLRGLNIFGTVKGKNSINTGIDLIKQYKMLITKDSNNLINEIYNYVWKKDKEGNLLDIPEGDDHILDALRYSCQYSLQKSGQKHFSLSFK